MSVKIAVITGPLEGLIFSIEEGTSVSLGRKRQNDIVLSGDPWVSSTHAVLQNRQGQIHLMDLGSSNGSFINGEKSKPKNWTQIHDFFVLGSTLLLAGQEVAVNNGDAISWDHPEAKFYRKHPLVVEALQVAKKSRCNLVGSIHLLQAAIQLDREYTMEKLYDFSTDIETVEKKLSKWKLFSGARDWINGFLVYQYQRRQEQSVLITPMAQQLVNQMLDNKEVHLLDLMLESSYSMLFPLLGLETPIILSAPRARQAAPASPPPALAIDVDSAPPAPAPSPAHTGLGPAPEPPSANLGAPPAPPAPPAPAYRDESESNLQPVRNQAKQPLQRHNILTPRLREAVLRALNRSRVIALYDDPRTGKSQTLRALLEPNGPVLRHARKVKRLDPRAFMAFHEASHFNNFIHELELFMEGNTVLAIDHADWLVPIFENLDLSLVDWLQKAQERRNPVLLCTDNAGIDALIQIDPNLEIVNLGQAAGKVTREAFLAACSGWEEEHGLNFSRDAKGYLEHEVVQKLGMTHFNHYLDALGHALDQVILEQNPTFIHITDHFVRQMFENWSAGAEDPTEPPRYRQNEELTDPGEVQIIPHESNFAMGIERLIHRFIREHLLGAIAYSDGSPALQVHYSLDGEAKRHELHEHLRLLLESVEPAFMQWFSNFVELIDPEEIRKQPDCKTDLAAAWKLFCRRFETVDTEQAKGAFLDALWHIMRAYLPRP